MGFFLLQLPVAVNVDQEALGSFATSPLALVAYGLLGLAVALWVAFAVMRWRLRRAYQTDVAFKSVVLLVTVPKEASEKGESGKQEKSLQEIQEDIAVMENVFGAIGGLKAEKGFKAWLLGRADSLSFEIVALKGLVSFYVAAPAHLRSFVESTIQSAFPHAQIEETPDYNIFSARGEVAAAQLGLERPSLFPIKSYKKYESDPLNALTNALSKVDKLDGAAIQVVVRSAPKAWRKKGVNTVKLMQKGATLEQALAGHSPGKESGAGQISGLVEGFSETIHGGSHEKGKEKEKELYKMTPREEEMIKDIDEKSSKFGLDVTIRVVSSAADEAKAELNLNNILNAFSQYALPQYGNQFKRKKKGKKVVKGFIFRDYDEESHMVLTGEELASVYHMPLASTETPNIRWLSARKAPPPPNLPKEGLHLGTVDYRGETTDVFIKREDRFRHIYMIGKSGTGKSKTIGNLAVQDILNGDGVCVIDPHGDLVEDVLGCVPKERADDVIVFDPSDLERPIALNMLEAPNEEMKDYVVGEMIAIFYKLFPPEMIGPMFEHQMRNYMLTLMSDPEVPGTIAEIPRLISDVPFQKAWRAKVKDPVVRSFWENEMDKTSDFHKSEMLGYLISKVGRFVENTMMRNIIGQQVSAFDFPDIMNSKKIFLVNLSKGKIGDINANLLGLIIVTKLQMAAMGRATMAEKDRKDFFLYIDEFQNFITPSIATILSEARKYRLSLIIAHQYLGQLSPKGDSEIRDAVLGNVGTMMIGRIGVEDAEVLEKEFAPVFTAFDLVNVGKFSFNSKILVNNQTTRPFNIQSDPPVKPDARILNALKQLSRLKFGRDREIVEEEILERTKIVATAPTKAA